MKFLIALMLFSSNLFAAKLNDWCDIKDNNGVVVSTALGTCDQYRGPIPQGGSLSPNTTKDAAEQAQFSAEQVRASSRANRKARLTTACAGAVGMLKDLCDHVLDML